MLIEFAVTPFSVPVSVFVTAPGPHGQGASPNIADARGGSVGGVVTTVSAEAGGISRPPGVVTVAAPRVEVAPGVEVAVLSAVLAGAVELGAAEVGDAARSLPHDDANRAAATAMVARREPERRIKSPQIQLCFGHRNMLF